MYRYMNIFKYETVIPHFTMSFSVVNQIICRRMPERVVRLPFTVLVRAGVGTTEFFFGLD